jgi:hypothetical protein
VNASELEEYGWANLSDYGKSPPSFKRAIPFLFAQLVYHWHEGKLASLLSVAHPLFQQKAIPRKRAYRHTSLMGWSS